MNVRVEKHSTLDKDFSVETEHLSLKVDFDDVNHPEVEAATKQLKEILEANWDEVRHMQLLREELIKKWEGDKYIQEDYNFSINDYLNDSGVKNVIQCDISELCRGMEISAWFPDENGNRIMESGTVDLINYDDNTVMMRHTHVECSVRVLNTDYIIFREDK